MNRFNLVMAVFVLGLGLVACSDDEPAASGTCAAPLQLQTDGTCACPAGTQWDGATCQTATTCGAGMMPDPANPSMCIATGPATCGAGMMPDPANPGTCVPTTPTTPTCGAGMMPDPANPSACVPTTPTCGAGMMPDPANPSMCIATPAAGPSCANADTTGDTFEAMQMMVTTKCGVCHRRSQAPRSANLQLTGDMSMDRADDFLSLVMKPACEVDMPVVDTSGGDAALANSWLYWKVASMPGPSRGLLEGRSEWTATMAACMQEGDFGTLMPQGVTEPQASVIEAVTNWICAGAPGAEGGSMGDAGMM